LLPGIRLRVLAHRLRLEGLAVTERVRLKALALLVLCLLVLLAVARLLGAREEPEPWEPIDVCTDGRIALMAEERRVLCWSAGDGGA
jgi:hypothetical protein